MRSPGSCASRRRGAGQALSGHGSVAGGEAEVAEAEVAEGAAVAAVAAEAEVAGVAEEAAAAECRQTIVAFPCPSTIVPLLSFERLSKKFSVGSLMLSAFTVTSTVFVRSVGAKVSVPEVAV